MDIFKQLEEFHKIAKDPELLVAQKTLTDQKYFGMGSDAVRRLASFYTKGIPALDATGEPHQYDAKAAPMDRCCGACAFGAGCVYVLLLLFRVTAAVCDLSASTSKKWHKASLATRRYNLKVATKSHKWSGR